MTLPTLVLIRHGETAWTLSGQHTGRSDIPLTAHGEDEARALARVLAPMRFSQVLTSPASRARRTCSLVLGGRHEAHPVAVEPALAEWDYGRYDGLDSGQIRALAPGWNLYRDGCPEGETPTQAVARADRLLARLRTLPGTIALFSHGQFGCLLGARWIGLAACAADRLALDTAAFSVLGPKPGHGDVPAILRWNVVAQARLS